MVVATFCLVIAGGLVTSTGSALAVPDWPLSFGQVFPPMVGGVFYEHGHRMVATTIGLFTIILAFWLWRQAEEPLLKKAGWIALGAGMCPGGAGWHHRPSEASGYHIDRPCLPRAGLFFLDELHRGHGLVVFYPCGLWQRIPESSRYAPQGMT